MNIRLTKNRQAILQALREVGDAVSAAQLREQLPEMDLATIYRNLELFTQEGLVKRLQLRGEALYEYQTKPHHHAICEKCEKMIHFTLSEEQLRKLIKVAGFTVSGVDVTVRGNCQAAHHRKT